jgi:hypothetical protein
MMVPMLQEFQVDSCNRQLLTATQYEELMSQKGEDLQRPDPLEGRYANSFQVGHNAFEFLLDFGQVAPESEKTQVHTRIITSPVYAKAFSEVLKESVNQYEQTFGVIPKDSESSEKGG